MELIAARAESKDLKIEQFLNPSEKKEIVTETLLNTLRDGLIPVATKVLSVKYLTIQMRTLLNLFRAETEDKRNFTNIEDFVYFLCKYQKSKSRKSKSWRDIKEKLLKSSLRPGHILKEVRDSV
jgi:hypothetical protein